MIVTREDAAEAIMEITKAKSWDAIEPKIYKEVCEVLGVDYGSYEDPDSMYNDMLKALGLIWDNYDDDDALIEDLKKLAGI